MNKVLFALVTFTCIPHTPTQAKIDPLHALFAGGAALVAGLGAHQLYTYCTTPNDKKIYQNAYKTAQTAQQDLDDIDIPYEIHSQRDLLVTINRGTIHNGTLLEYKKHIDTHIHNAKKWYEQLNTQHDILIKRITAIKNDAQAYKQPEILDYIPRYKKLKKKMLVLIHTYQHMLNTLQVIKNTIKQMPEYQLEKYSNHLDTCTKKYKNLKNYYCSIKRDYATELGLCASIGIASELSYQLQNYICPYSSALTRADHAILMYTSTLDSKLYDLERKQTELITLQQHVEHYADKIHRNHSVSHMHKVEYSHAFGHLQKQIKKLKHKFSKSIKTLQTIRLHVTALEVYRAAVNYHNECKEQKRIERLEKEKERLRQEKECLEQERRDRDIRDFIALWH